jgi:peptidoglycan/LPS O-acetylase OafA/YrhL
MNRETDTSALTTPTRFYSLDVLRGLASLAVVLWHYQNFFFVSPETPAPSFTRSDQPLYFILFPIYEQGLRAVQLFFVLSGFIFYWLYQRSIADRRVSAYQFVVLRFSRLYPLHFLTLILTATGQWLYFRKEEMWFVYSNNDLRHFVLNLFLINHWGIQDGLSFNAPTWSVSVEILLYGTFFVLALARHLGMVMSLAVAAVGGTLTIAGHLDVGSGIFCFFVGGATYLLYEKIHALLAARPELRANFNLGTMLLMCSGLIATTALPKFLADLVLIGCVFPCVVLGLAVYESHRTGFGRRYRSIGDLTYATYLTHFPVQLALGLSSAYLGYQLDYTRPISLVIYVSAVIAVSIPTYYGFELRAQRRLRQALLGARWKR